MSSPHQRAKAIAKRRMQVLRQFEQMRQQTNGRRAARELRLTFSTLWRWQRDYQAHGMEGLIPHFTNSGRRSAAEGIQFTPEAISEMQRLILSFGNERRAWQQFCKGPHCPPALSEMAFVEAPAPFRRLYQLRPMQVRCFSSADGQVFFQFTPKQPQSKFASRQRRCNVSADGRRLFIKIKGGEK